MPDGSNRLPGALQAKRKPGRPRTLRTAANAEIICSMVEQGLGLPAVAAHLGCTCTSIVKWIREDETQNGGAAISAAYARAREAAWEVMADEVVALADDQSFLAHPELASAFVQQQRLAVDTRKWLLSKVLPKRFGDRIEVAGDADAPLVTRIELVAVHPQLPSRVIDNDEALPSEGTHKPQKR